MPQLIGQIHMDGVGVHKTSGLIPQGVKLLFAVFPDVHDFWGLIDAFPFFKNRDQQLS